MNFGLDSRPRAEQYRHADGRSVLTPGGQVHPSMSSESERRLAEIAATIYANAWRLDNRQLDVLVGFIQMHKR